MSTAGELKIIYFDGLCLLCNGLVQFLIKRDKENILLFASIQGSSGQAMLKHFADKAAVDGIVFVDNGKIYTKSEACLHIAKNMTYPWPVLKFLKIIPLFIRDAVYDWVAKNRYRWFGKRDACMLPAKNQAYKFLP